MRRQVFFLLSLALAVSLAVLPGGMAAWQKDIEISGSVTTGEFKADSKKEAAGNPGPAKSKDNAAGVLAGGPEGNTGSGQSQGEGAK